MTSWLQPIAPATPPDPPMYCPAAPALAFFSISFSTYHSLLICLLNFSLRLLLVISIMTWTQQLTTAEKPSNRPTDMRNKHHN